MADLKKTKNFKYFWLVLAAALLVAVLGGVHWVWSTGGGGPTQVGGDVQVGSSVILGRDIYVGGVKVYDSATGQVPLGALPSGIVD